MDNQAEELLKNFLSFIILFSIIQNVACSESLGNGVDDNLSSIAVINTLLKEKFPSRYSCFVTDVPRGVILSFNDSELFEPDSLKLSQNGKLLLDKVVQILGGISNNCTIEGHSSNTKNITEWEHSMIKADKITEYVISKNKNLSERIFSLGLGESEPAKTNSCNAGDAENRVDFVFMEYEFKR